VVHRPSESTEPKCRPATGAWTLRSSTPAARTHGEFGPRDAFQQLSTEFGLPPKAGIDHFVREVRRLPGARPGEPEDVDRVITHLPSQITGQVTYAERAVDRGAPRQT
jgi:hypothetical protein